MPQGISRCKAGSGICLANPMTAPTVLFSFPFGRFSGIGEDMRILVLLLLLAGDLKSELDSLVQAERAFARLSMAQGVRDAFLANLANDSIIFRPTAVAGRQWFETNTP